MEKYRPKQNKKIDKYSLKTVCPAWKTKGKTNILLHPVFDKNKFANIFYIKYIN